MKRLFVVLLVACAAFVMSARAQSPDDQYVRIYNLIQEGDTFNNLDQPGPALPKYLEAQSALQKFQKVFPEWHSKVVNYRLNYLASKIAAVTARAPVAAIRAATNAPGRTGAPTAPSTATTEVERQTADLRSELRSLQSEKTVLEAKLREALATQPAAIDPRELGRAQEKIQSLLKENELLKANLPPDQAVPAASTKALEEMKKALAQANRELADQTQRAKSLAAEKQALQEKLENAKANDELAANLASTQKAFNEASRKLNEQTELATRLARENEALQSRIRTLTAKAEAADALRAENELLKKQVAELKTAVAANANAADLARQLAQAQAQIASLQSDADILRLEKIALQDRVKQLSGPSAPATLVRSPHLLEDADQIKQLERERDDLRKRLESTTKELYGRTGKETGARIETLTGEIMALRARLEVFEARAVPYSAEELALLKASTGQLAAVDPNNGRQAAKQFSPATRALLVEAQRYFSSHEYEKAEAKYLEILRQDDKNVYTLANLAAIQLELNHLEDADKNIKQALTVAPEDGYSLSILGYLRFRQEKFEEALDALSRAAKLNPDSAEIQNYLGVTLSHKGQRGPAENALRKAIQLDPGYGSAHNNLAVIYITQPQPSVELARWHYQKALAAGHPRNADLEKMLDQKSAGGNKP